MTQSELEAYDAMMADRDRWKARSIELGEALRKAVAWGDAASTHILYRENINWRYLDEARATFARYSLHNAKTEGPPTQDSKETNQ